MPEQSSVQKSVSIIRDSFGEAIAKEAAQILQEDGGAQLSFLSLVAAAETRLYEHSHGSLINQAKERTDSRISVDDEPPRA